MNEIIAIVIAAVLSWFNFVLIDTWMGLPEKPGVKGADVIGRSVLRRGRRSCRRILPGKHCMFSRCICRNTTCISSMLYHRNS